MESICKKYKVKYSYTTPDLKAIYVEKHGCKMSIKKPTEKELLEWAEYNTIGGGNDFKILSISEPY